MDVYDAADRHIKEGHPLIILAGAAYGSGSSRDWAAKGPYLQVSPFFVHFSSVFFLKIETFHLNQTFLLNQFKQ